MSIASTLQTTFTAALSGISKPTVPSVRAGEPDTLNVATVAYWYTGTRTWQANTFSQTQELSCWHIRVYQPAPARFTPEDGGVDAWLEDVVNALRGAVYAHVGLGGAATGTGLTLSDATAGWLQTGAVLCRVADMDLEAMLTAVHPIAA